MLPQPTLRCSLLKSLPAWPRVPCGHVLLSGVMAEAQARKKAKVTTGIVPQEIGTTRIKLDDISLSEESGWRDLDPIRVKELVSSFLSGEYMQGIFAKPSVLQALRRS